MTVKSYALIREIARGGMAEIWLARQSGPLKLERPVVIKRIIASSAEEPAFVEMFLDEARIASQLSHPNIVQVFELGEHSGSYFIVMEYVPGQNLARVVRAVTKDGGSFSIALAVKLIALAADGLGYAHTRKGLDGKPLEIVHRDVSPQNVIITYDGHLKVLDFGIAKASNRLTRTKTGLVKGKLAYMAPEQALGEPVGAAADVFSLGVMLFELVTGTRLYGEATEVEIVRMIATHKPFPNARSRKPDVPDDLDRLISKAMCPHAALRFQDGRELHLALEAWLKQRTDAPSVADLEQLMLTLFGERVDELRAELEAAQSGIVLEASKEPSSPSAISKSMPGATPRSELETVQSRREAPPQSNRLSVVLAASGLLALGAAITLVMVPRVLPQAAPQAELKGAPPPPQPKPAEPPPEPLKVAVPVVVDAGAPEVAVAAVETKHPAAAKGRLTLDTTPWTRVYLGKTVLGDTPLIEVPLPVGLQKLKLVNDAEGVSSVVEVQIRPGQTTVKKLSF
jgi:eukaryotic-like serine/threonine-protein kinase